MPPTRHPFDEFPNLLAWTARVRGVGHGERSERQPEEAIGVAPDDYGYDPVEGEVVAPKLHATAIRRVAPEVGEVVVHFPRAGFRVTRV